MAKVVLISKKRMEYALFCDLLTRNNQFLFSLNIYFMYFCKTLIKTIHFYDTYCRWW